MQHEFTFSPDSSATPEPVEIPYGYCHCGCGQKTRIAPYSCRRDGNIKGEPVRFVKHHGSRRNRLSDIWTKINVGDPEQCWAVFRSSRPDGYGMFSVNGQHLLTHRAAWIATHGPIPEGLDVLHKCDNPPCCNPNHLFLGTHADNMADMAHKKRGGPPRGTRHPRSKINEDIVKATRTLRQNGLTCKAIAATLNVPMATVSNIIYKRCWNHVL